MRRCQLYILKHHGGPNDLACSPHCRQSGGFSERTPTTPSLVSRPRVSLLAPPIHLLRTSAMHRLSQSLCPLFYIQILLFFLFFDSSLLPTPCQLIFRHIPEEINKHYRICEVRKAFNNPPYLCWRI